MTAIIQDSLKTDEQIKEFHRKRLEQLELSHIGDISQLDEPTYEQKQWVLRKLKAPVSSWRRCC